MKRTKKSKLNLNRRSVRKLDSKSMKQAAGGTNHENVFMFPTLICTDGGGH